MAQCPACSHFFHPLVELPIEPLFTADVAAELVPFNSAEHLREYVGRRHPDWERRYRTATFPDGRRRVVRLFSAGELRTLRQEIVRGTLKRQRPARDRASAPAPDAGVA